MNKPILNKICPQCKQEFKTTTVNQKYCSRKCVYLSNPKAIYSEKNEAKKRWYGIRNNAKRFNGEICSIEEFSKFWLTPHICGYCGIKEEIWLSKFKRRLEIYRKDNSTGYLLSNITWACHRCNTIKCNLLTYEDMKEIGEKYIKPKWLNI